MIVQEIHVSAGMPIITPKLCAVQNDTGRSLELIFDDLELVSGMTGVLDVLRPNGTRYGISASRQSSTTFLVENLDQALTSAGVVQCQFKVFQNGDVVSAFTFEVLVYPDLSGSITEEEYWSIENAISAALAVEEYNFDSKVDKTQKVNNIALSGNIVLKSSNFSESITGEQMLAGLTYSVVSTF